MKNHIGNMIVKKIEQNCKY